MYGPRKWRPIACPRCGLVRTEPRAPAKIFMELHRRTHPEKPIWEGEFYAAGEEAVRKASETVSRDAASTHR